MRFFVKKITTLGVCNKILGFSVILIRAKRIAEGVRHEKEKTNVMRVLDSKKIKYNEYYYGDTEAVSGVDVAKALGQNPENVFKTLVTTGKSGEHYVFMVPVAEELDLKKAAKAVGEKSIAMLKSKELLGLTGYIHGGCSPIGMKKLFKTTIHKTAPDFDTILFSGGKIGFQVEIPFEDFKKVINVNTADIIVEAV